VAFGFSLNTSKHVWCRILNKVIAFIQYKRKGERVAIRERQQEDHDRDAIPGVRLSTIMEGHAFFDRQSRKLLNISGDEFLRHWDAGAYRPIPDTAEGRKIRRLVMLMPFARRTNA
jgi:hypothetical protein